MDDKKNLSKPWICGAMSAWPFHNKQWKCHTSLLLWRVLCYFESCTNERGGLEVMFHLIVCGAWNRPLLSQATHVQRPRQEPFHILLVFCFSPFQLSPCLIQFIRIGAAGSPAVLHLLSSLTCMMFYWTCIINGTVPSPLWQPERVAS